MRSDAFWSLWRDDKAVEEAELPMAPTDLVLEASLLEVALMRRLRAPAEGARFARSEGRLSYAPRRKREGNEIRTREA